MTSSAQARILVVDDTLHVRRLLLQVLPVRLPFSVCITTAHSGNTAIQLLEQGAQFEMIISDYSMDDGNGADLFQYLSDVKSPIPFVLFTSALDPVLPPTGNTIFIGIVEKFQIDLLVEATTTVLASCVVSSN